LWLVSTYDAVIFDLDGTLVDSAPLIRLSFNHATRTVLGFELPFAEAVPYMIQPLEDQMRALSEDRWEELCSVYMEHNHEWHERLIRTFEGVPEAVAVLRQSVRSLAVVTSKRRDATETALRDLGMADLFDEVVTYEDTELHKPNPDPILTCLARLDVRASAGVYVGDTPTDLQAAKAAGVDAAAVAWGFYDLSELAELEPTHLLRMPCDLVGLAARDAIDHAESGPC
jgi:pyrophosphatase PpaX